MADDSTLEKPEKPRRVSAGPQRSKASSEAILAAAEAILEEDGYAGFSFERVARRAGAGKPTLYRWWPTKAALLVDVYIHQKERMLDRDTGTLEGDLVAMIGALWTLWRQTRAGEAFRSLIAEAQHDPASREALNGFLARRHDAFFAILDRAIARGEIAPGIDRTLAVDLVFGFSWIRLLTGRIDDDAIAPAVRQMVGGLAPTRR